MSKEYTLADFTDIFDYSTGWFSDSSICSLFYQIFKRFPSMKMVKYKVNQDFLKEIKELYQQDDAFDIFEHIYCNHFENEKEEEEEEEDTSTKELYDCIVICKKNLMIGYFDNCTKIAYSNIDKEEIDMDEEELMMAALDAGAEDFAAEEDSYEITTAPDDFSAVRETLEAAGIPMASAEVTMIPQTYTELTDEEDIKKMNKLLEMLDDDDDVQNTYHNWDE